MKKNITLGIISIVIIALLVSVIHVFCILKIRIHQIKEENKIIELIDTNNKQLKKKAEKTRVNKFKKNRIKETEKLLSNYNFNNVKEILYFRNDYDYKAQKILFNYLLKENRKNENIKDDLLQRGLNAAMAYLVDLNNDGEDEIIGIYDSFYYKGALGAHLFILEKRYNEYRDISGYLHGFRYPITVFNNTTNGYSDLKVYGAALYQPFQMHILKYASKFSGYIDCTYYKPLKY